MRLACGLLMSTERGGRLRTVTADTGQWAGQSLSACAPQQGLLGAAGSGDLGVHPHSHRGGRQAPEQRCHRPVSGASSRSTETDVCGQGGAELPANAAAGYLEVRAVSSVRRPVSSNSAGDLTLPPAPLAPQHHVP